MSMQTLVRGIDDQFVPEVRQKAALEKFIPQVQDNHKPGDWHEGLQKWRSEEADGLCAETTKYFGALARQEGVYPEPEEQKYWEDYWLKELAVNRKWPEPRREHKVRQFANDWWALMKVFEHEGSPAWPEHPNASVHKAFNTNTLQSVFPIFFDTNIVAGLLANPVLDRLIARSVAVDSHTVTHVTMTESDADATMGEAGEGTTAIQLIVKEAERQIKLRKFMGEVDWTYEVMRLQRLDILALSIRRIGTRWTQLKTDFGLATLIDGDGAGDGAAPTQAAAGAALAYPDFIAAELKFPNGYNPDTIVMPKEIISKTLNLAQYQDPLAGILHQTTGAYPNPVGMDLVRWDSTGRVSTYTANTAVMFQSNLALVEYTEGGIITESERIIRSQWEKSVTSQWVGYAVWDRNAAVLMTGL